MDPRAALRSAIALVCAGSFALAGPESRVELELSPVAQVLIPAVARRERGSPELVAAIARLGPGQLSELLATAARAAVVIPIEGGRELSIQLSPELCQVVLDGLARLPRPAVLGHLARLDPPAEAEAFRVAGIELLGRIAGRDELGLLLRIAGRERVVGCVPYERGRAFHEALEAIAGRERDVPWHELYARAHPALLAPLIEVVALHAGAEDLERMTELLGARPEADHLLLLEIGRRARPDGPPPPEDLPLQARHRLGSSDPLVQRAAIDVAAALEDVEATEALAGLLDRAELGLARAAHAALVRIAGLDLGRAPAVWIEWYRSERGWWQVEARVLERRLRSGTTLEALKAVREVGRHRIQRRERAWLLALALARPESDLLRVACGTLARVGTQSEAADVAGLASHADPGVRRAAERALEALQY